MNRRSFLVSVAAPLSTALLFAACGDDAAGDRPPDGTDAPATTRPPTTSPPATAPPTTAPPTAVPGIAHPTGAEDVVLRLSADGGFVPVDFLFVRLPRILVTGDGSVYALGAQIEIYPQPLLPPLLVGRLSEERLQQLLRSASDAGLFSQIGYGPPPVDVTDLPDTVLTINANGTTYTHTAYALGFEAEDEDTDRKAFADYAALLDTLAADDLGFQPFTTTKYAIRSMPADLMVPPDDVVPSEIDWPAAAGVKLVDAAECQVVEASAVGAAFAEASQISRFIDAGVKYLLFVRPLLPGDPGC